MTDGQNVPMPLFWLRVSAQSLTEVSIPVITECYGIETDRLLNEKSLIQLAKETSMSARFGFNFLP